jgi:DNA gyrase/topoisomerase IV subunit B
LRDFIKSHVPHRGELLPEDLCAGLTSVISVWLRDPYFPYFDGATYPRVDYAELETIVTRVVRRSLREYFEANREAAKRVVDAAIMAREVRVAAQAARATLRANEKAEADQRRQQRQAERSE